MKSKLIITVMAFVLAGFSAQAQTTDLKIGYTNVDYVLSLLPEAKSIESQIKEYEAQLGKQMQSKEQELRTKFEAYQKEAPNMTEIVRTDKEEELQNMQASLQKFGRDAEVSLQQKQVELLKPAYEKIQNTISEVAKENGYTHVFSNDAGGFAVLLYASEEDDISNLVLAKLGVTPPPPAATGTE